jgi:hypothetical protein
MVSLKKIRDYISMLVKNHLLNKIDVPLSFHKKDMAHQINISLHKGFQKNRLLFEKKQKYIK